jgi:hypothetical protein
MTWDGVWRDSVLAAFFYQRIIFTYAHLHTEKIAISEKTQEEIFYSTYSYVLTAFVMKSSAFWDITPHSPQKVNQNFGGKCRPHFQGRRIIRARNQLCLLPASFWFLAWLIFGPEDEGDVPPKRRLNFNGLHGVIWQNTELLNKWFVLL